jgi:hypothetical protein
MKWDRMAWTGFIWLQDNDQCWALVNKAANPQVSKNEVNFLSSSETFCFPRRNLLHRAAEQELLTCTVEKELLTSKRDQPAVHVMSARSIESVLVSSGPRLVVFLFLP